MKEGWEYKTLGEVCKIYNGNSINADYKKKHFLGATGGLPFIATKDVSPLGTIDYNNGVRIPNYEEYKVAPANSVFICAEGGSAGKKFAYVEKDVCFGNKLFCITPKDKAIKGKFIYHFVQSDNFRGQFFSLLTGLIGGVSAKKFQTIEIPVPSLSEQQSIVDYLDSAFAKIDAMKANAEKALNEAKALFQASLKEMLEPKEGWEEKTLLVLTSKIGSGATPKGGRKVYIDEGCHLIRSMNVQYNEFKYEDLAHITDEAAEQLKGVEIQENDVLFNITGASIARCCVVPTDALPARVNQHVSILRLKQDVLPRFLSYILNSPKHQRELLEIGEAGSTRQALTKTDLENHVICYPNIDSQIKLLYTLDSLKSKVDRLQENYNKISQECDALKQAILRQVFE